MRVWVLVHPESFSLASTVGAFAEGTHWKEFDRLPRFPFCDGTPVGSQRFYVKVPGELRAAFRPCEACQAATEASTWVEMELTLVWAPTTWAPAPQPTGRIIELDDN